MTYDLLKNVSDKSSLRQEFPSDKTNPFLLSVFKYNILESFAAQSSTAIGVFDGKFLNYIYHTSNLPGLIHKMSMKRSIALLEQQLIPFVPKQKRSLITTSICGSLYPGSKRKILLQSSPLTFDEEHFPELYLESVRNVTHLVSGEGFWLRMNYGEETICWFPNRKKLWKHDILSKREKEVISLLAKDKPLACIGDELEISIHTVKNHLKTASARLFARNNNSLVQLSILSGILTI